MTAANQQNVPVSLTEINHGYGWFVAGIGIMSIGGCVMSFFFCYLNSEVFPVKTLSNSIRSLA